MKHDTLPQRLLALILAAVLCLSFVPWAAFAAETGTYTQVTSAEDFTSGQYVLVSDTGYAPTVLSGDWILAGSPTVTDDVVTDTAGAVWTLTVDGSSVKLTDANGVTVAPKGGNNNGILSGDYSWDWSFADGKFTFAGTGKDTVLLASNATSSGKNQFKGYKTTTVIANSRYYFSAFTAYKLVEKTPEPEPSEPEVVISTIAEAKAMASGTESITVQGTVILVNGQNVVVQDASGGINLYFTAAPADITVGDMIQATGNRSTLNGLEQLSGVETFAHLGTAPLPVKEVTIAEILADQDTSALESTRVVIKGAVLGATAEHDTWLTQGESAIHIFNTPTLEGIAEGDTVDVTAIVGDYNGYQLNVNAPGDVVKLPSPEEPSWNGVDKKYDVYELVNAPANGDTVVIYNPGNGKALSSQETSYYMAGVDAAVTGEGYIAFDSDTIAWTVSIDENGQYGFAQKDMTLGVQQDGSYINLNTNAGDDGFVVTPFTEGGNVYRVRSSTVENSFGFAHLNWFDDKSAFSVYATSGDNTDEKDFGFQFYKLVRQGVREEQPEDPAEPEGSTAALVTDAPANLDKVYIYYPESGLVLSDTDDGAKLSGVAGTVTGNYLEVAEGMVELVVAADENGCYSFLTADGRCLTSGNTGSSLFFAEAASDYSLWTLETGENGWFIRNANAVYSENAQYLAYCSGFTTFGMNADNEGAYTFRFYKSGVAESLPETGEMPDDPAPAGIADGDYVIWAPAYSKALSSVYDGYYNNGVDVTLSGEILSGYENTEIWTVTNNGDGTITISCAEGKLSMDTGYTSMPLDKINNTWTIQDAGDGLWYVKNLGRGAYIEWYAEKKYWSGYEHIQEGAEGMFALRFTPAKKSLATDSSVVENIAQWGGMTSAENTSFICGDRYVSGDELDTQDIYTAVVGGKTVAPWTKGGSKDAPLYYMGAKGIGSGSGDYLQLAVNTAGWGGMELSFRLRASDAGPGSFQLKYSVDSGTTWQNFSTGLYSYGWTKWGKNDAGESVIVDSGISTGNITDGNARTSLNPGSYMEFFFDVPSGADNCENLLIRLVPGTERAKGEGTIDGGGTVRMDTVVLCGSPLVADSITGFVSVQPDGTVDQAAGSLLTMTSATGDATIFYRMDGGEWQTYDEANKPALNTLPCHLEVYASTEGRRDSVVRLYTYAAGTVEAVKFSPNGGGVYIAGESEQILLSTATEGAAIYFATSGDGVNFSGFAEYSQPIVVNKGFGKLAIRAYAEKEGYTSSQVVTRTFTERLSEGYQIFFGQLHSHTNISDGTGTVEEAFRHAYDVDNLDFLAVTDHSNSFDGESSGVISQDGSAISSEWAQGHAAAKAVTDETFVGLYGYEMTWSNGLGHINTFNTPGWQSRSQADYKTQSTALQNYYAALATVPESISQFNHPGTTFGDFSDFAHYTEDTDALITLIEVGNGEGAIGSSGYFPSYEYYTRALDRGWHVAPTNNQDNHKGLWGDANTGRSVILADSLTEESIYDALRNYRVYATEDNDLSVYYTLNGQVMGSMLESTDGENVTVSVEISDPTDTAIGKVEVIVNGGFTAASTSLNASSGTVTLSVPAAYNYYYVRITQPDGDIAVTAPVWVGQVEAVGISSLEAKTQLTIAGEEQTFTVELFNNEKQDLLVDSLVYTDQATGEVIYTETGITVLGRESTASSSFVHTFAADGIHTITATLKGTLNGKGKTYTKDLEVTVMPRAAASSIIVDGTHFNDYVTGYYGDHMGNMTAIAAARGIRVHVEKNAITPEMLENCSLLVISAPAKKNGTGNGGDFTAKPFEDDFIALVADYVKSGGNVIICGLADYQDKGAPAPENHSAHQINKLLAAIGTTMRIQDDQVTDDSNNGGQAFRLYPEIFNGESVWCEGIVAGQVYSFYSGCSVNPGQGTWLVKGFDTSYGSDADGDGLGGSSARVAGSGPVLLACENTPYGGTIFVGGSVFISDFEVKAELDNIWDLPYANRTIYENIIGITRAQPEITPIAHVRASTQEALGRIFVVEGYVTAGTANPNTTFFDAIYIQDSSGGITVFPYSDPGLELGTKVRVTGYTDDYQGDIEIQIMSMDILEEPRNVVTPEKVSAKDAMDYENKGGQLLQVEGVVTEVVLTSDGQGVAQFVVRDQQGDSARVFIDGYILSGTTGENTLAGIVKEGNTVSAVGLMYLHPEGESARSIPVLRVRDCDEVVLVKEKAEEPETPTEPSAPSEPTLPSEPTEPSEPSEPSEPTEPARPSTDKSRLKQAMDTAEAKKQKDYSKKSWDALQAALKAAEGIYSNPDATQEEIDNATDALNKAIHALAPATGKNPETGDNAMPGLSLGIMAAALGAILVLVINRKKFKR